MNEIRRSAERGHANHGWLDSFHSFSFADYHDARHMGFSALRVINEDRIKPGTGFGTHGHRDMEIITYVLQGALEHKDSMGNGSAILPGEVQYMSAGSGVRHSEFNHEPDCETHLLQIWIEPDVEGAPPAYDQKAFPAAEKRGKLRPVVTPDGREGSVKMRQDATLYAALIDGAERAVHELAKSRRAYVHVARGSLSVNGQPLQAGDALKTDAAQIVLEQGDGAEVLLFDLP
ncbi:MAG: pirin family protein [Betaproteobacteria bacterium]|nr:pirin family protein [Betaproteobacteria bacterium]